MLTALGRYQIDQLLARGGMGEVYLGRVVGAHGFSRQVVIKVIRTELVADERVALMFVDEARIAAGLHHRNIVQILDFDLFESGAFLMRRSMLRFSRNAVSPSTSCARSPQHRPDPRLRPVRERRVPGHRVHHRL